MFVTRRALQRWSARREETEAASETGKKLLSAQPRDNKLICLALDASNELPRDVMPETSKEVAMVSDSGWNGSRK